MPMQTMPTLVAESALAKDWLTPEEDGPGQFVRGDDVVLNFPFSDLSQTKRRPALGQVVFQIPAAQSQINLRRAQLYPMAAVEMLGCIMVNSIEILEPSPFPYMYTRRGLMG